MKKKCDESRPCKRCVRRGIEGECRDRNGETFHFTQDCFNKPMPISHLAWSTVPNSPQGYNSPIGCDTKSCHSGLSSSSSFSSDDEFSLRELSLGFWNQFPTGLSRQAIQSAVTWYQKYSPMYICEMTEANTISRRKYLNLVMCLVSMDAMQIVHREMMEIAAQVSPLGRDLFMEKYWVQHGIPYVGFQMYCQTMNPLHLSVEFCKAVLLAWPELASFDDIYNNVSLFQVHLVECQDENTGDLFCRMSFDFNPFFEKTMKTSVDLATRQIQDTFQVKIKTGHPICWVFNESHWDLLMEFVLYGFFNQSNFMQGTFALAEWDPKKFQSPSASPSFANVVGHSCFDSTYSHVSFSFALRKI